MDTQFRLAIIGFIGILTVIVWTLPEWWALANPESPVAQGLPGLELEARAMFDDLPQNEQEAYFEIYEGDEDFEVEPRPEWALALVRARFFGQDFSAPEAVQPFEVPAGAIAVTNGQWLGVDAVRTAEGDITIYRLPDGTRLLRFEEGFTSTLAPDIRVVFTRNPDPSDDRGVGVDRVDLGTIRGNVGAQNYIVPESVDFSVYPVMALYSEEFDEIIATLTLR